MKSKTVFVSLILVAIVGVGLVAYFVSRPQQQEPLPQQFAKLPAKPALIAEFHHGPSIYSVAISPVDPSLIASVDENGTIKLWARNNTKDPVRILSHPGGFTSLGFSPTGELLASSGFGTLVLWDVASGKKINSLESSYSEFAFSPDGRQLATVRNGVKLWDIRNRKKITEVATLPFNEAGRVNGWWACAVDISPDGKLIATRYANGTINVWNLQTKQLLKTLKTSLSERDFSNSRQTTNS